MDSLLTGSTAINSTLSPAVQEALKNASPEDVAHFSQAALELQQADGLFSSPDASSAGSSLGSLLQSLQLADSSSDTSAGKLAAYKGYIAAQQSDSLFGTNAPSLTSFLG